MSRLLLTVLFVLGGLLAAPGATRAADICTGYIDSVPTVVSTQGVWCLRKDLGTAMTSGNAITITANNVTIDCNDFKLGGLAAGDSSGAVGIVALSRQNVTVRRCNVRGFRFGIAILDGAGHLVEDNRLDNNLYVGIQVRGDNNLVQRNRVYDTGGRPASGTSYGIDAEADVIDNTVDGVFATTTDTFLRGIGLAGAGTEARGNRVRGLAVAGAGNAVGIEVVAGGTRVEGNHVSATVATAGTGIVGLSDPGTFCRNNTVANFADAIATCQDVGGNAVLGEAP